MKGLDTNVLVRYLAGDDPRQSPKAREILLVECTPEDPGVINRVVLCELAWVLKRSYGFSRDQIADSIEKLFTTAELLLEDDADVWEALALYRRGEADFSDCLVGLTNAGMGCESTLTFDRNAGRLETFSLIE
jgi:predicted nucleic-acid-binding protein